MVGARPIPVLIDGAVVQNSSQSFNFNGESDLDLQYGMGLTAPQPVTLLQTGDLSQGQYNFCFCPYDQDSLKTQVPDLIIGSMLLTAPSAPSMEGTIPSRSVLV